MPTGYTAALYEGKDVTFRDFVLRCVRGMTVAILLRDDDMDVVPTAENINGGRGGSSYAEERLRKVRADLEHWKNLKGPALLAATEALNAERREALRKETETREWRLDAYQGMIEQVEAWDPPTPEHVPFKEFMLGQLQSSIEFDCYPVEATWFSEYTPRDLRALRIGNLTQEIERLEEDVVKEREGCAWRLAWIEALYESLPEVTRV